MTVSASTKQNTSPVAARAPPLRAAAMQRCSTSTTTQPRSRASRGVASVDRLLATTISMVSGGPAQRARAASTLSSRRGSSAASL
jgi:hypothetical protein